VEVIPLHALLVHNVRSLLMILLGATGFVLLIACANVTNLLLSRGVARGREIAVRVALGAGRLRLIRQLLTEGLLLVVIGALLGSVTGLWATKILKELIPAGLPADVHLDPRIFAFSAAMSAVALLVFGLVPALIASRTDVNETLKEGGLHLVAISGTHRLRGLMAAGEIALSLILLIGAGLLSRSFLRLTEVPLGFDPNHLLIATVARPLTVDFNSQLHAAFFRDSLHRIRSLPGVIQAALAQRYPLGPPRNATLVVHVQGAEDFRPGQPVSVTAISPDYFHLMGVRLLSGRTFNEGDVADTERVVVLNQRLAHMIFGDRNPLGQHIGFGPPPAPWSEIVGTVADMREDALEREPAPELFVPYTQHPSFVMSFMLRTDSNPDALASAVRSAVAGTDKNQPVSEILTMDEVLANSVAPRRFRALLLGLFAALALLLAVIGIYGVIAYSCSLRTSEFGIRIALGAKESDILKLVVQQGFGLMMIGLAAGIAGAIGLTRYLSSLLYEVKPTDPLTFVLVSVLLATVVLFASCIPARRAMRVNPVAALRDE
jgi:putative ABC transport system permease protein